MCLYQRIKARREELGLSQEELANRLGYKSRSTINKIESGVNDIPQSKIKAFADALNTTPGYLMGWAEQSDTSKVISTDENNLIQTYNKLNYLGKREAIKRIIELTQIPKYTTEEKDYLMPIAAHNDNITDEELELINQDLADMDNW